MKRIILFSSIFLVFLSLFVFNNQRIVIYCDINEFFDYDLSLTNFEILHVYNLKLSNDPSDTRYGVELRPNRCKDFELSLKDQDVIVKDSLVKVVLPFFYENILENEGKLLLRKKARLHYAITFYEINTCTLYFEYSKF